ncbi:DUF1697 domain-containing protein [Polaribacter sargassicola]|uniref:DUF1697 domain-containing protein n=1 Tax=Polaribacter sargassicola TaxID=2836891 RepID=UPI001F20B501|nr:DUF1697 domain-containing protein [Polaribacter sp. DS7-9]MCG1035638.1 DUF1697 domain-containing protein [Polaribacter sp. DS7-9]
MKTYILLLRGINVSGKNKIPMVELRKLLNDLQFKNVQTYIQSGNIILQSDKSKEEVGNQVKIEIKNKFGFEVPVIVKTITEVEKIFKNYPFSLENEKIVAFCFLEKPVKEIILDIKNTGEDQYKVDNDVVYLNCVSGFGKTKLTNNTIEKKLNAIATTRNFKTTKKLLELSKS